MTTKGQDPRSDQPTDDDTEGHGSRYGFKAMPTDATQTDTVEPTDDDTTGHAYKSWRAGDVGHDDTTKKDNKDQNLDDDTEGHASRYNY